MLAQITDTLWEFFDSLLDVFYDIKNARQRRVSNKVEVWMLGDSRDIDKKKGLITKDGKLCIIESANIPIVNPVIYKYGRKQYVFQPSGLHEGIPHEKIKGLSESQTYTALVRWKHLRKWVTTEVSSKGSIDFTHFNNDISPDFMTSTFKMIQSTVVDKLFSELQTGQKIMYVLIGMGFGGTIFGFGLLVFHIILAYFS